MEYCVSQRCVYVCARVHMHIHLFDILSVANGAIIVNMKGIPSTTRQHPIPQIKLV